MQYNPAISIIEYEPSLQAQLKKLNYEWLVKYFAVEEGDERSLSNPQEEILDKGGVIYFAKLNDEIVGTASLLHNGAGLYELGKMAVTATAQGHGVGTQLLHHCIQQARQMGSKKLILYSNSQLAAALHLYTKVGFVQVALEQGIYKRADIKMELLM